MSDKKHDDPTNRVVCIFESHANAVAARNALLATGFSADQVELWHGDKEASEVDISAKWFADTDEELKKFESSLRAGNTVLSVPIKDGKRRDEVYQLLKSHEALHVTHFGEWVTEVMQ